MKLFSCSKCHALVFFENTTCLKCGAALGFDPDTRTMIALVPMDGDSSRFQAVTAGERRSYRLCRNYAESNACNWLLATDDANPFCHSCRLSRTIPPLDEESLRQRWRQLEAAKRRLWYGLAALNLTLRAKSEDPKHGVSFDFLVSTSDKKVITGHDDGVITIDCAEADDVCREEAKAHLHENYRTLLGHFRHEIGHFYWDQLIRDGERLAGFRALFGNEQADYALAQQGYYQSGPAKEWPDHFISAYASMHPWEDWAETWAHYLHMADVVEVGAEFGISLASTPVTTDGDTHSVHLDAIQSDAFDQLLTAWRPLTYAVNSLNRAMGLKDWYPFTPSDQAVAKLRFVHETISKAGQLRPAPIAGLPDAPVPVRASA